MADTQTWKSSCQGAEQGLRSWPTPWKTTCVGSLRPKVSLCGTPVWQWVQTVGRGDPILLLCHWDTSGCSSWIMLWVGTGNWRDRACARSGLQSHPRESSKPTHVKRPLALPQL